MVKHKMMILPLEIPQTSTKPLIWLMHIYVDAELFFPHDCCALCKILRQIPPLRNKLGTSKILEDVRLRWVVYTFAGPNIMICIEVLYIICLA